jgi:hypothetical protein
MKKSIKKFLQFNGRAISFLSIDGTYWVAIRPICEALNVSYAWHYQQLKKHPIWGDVYGKPTMHDAKNRLQKMVALPEKYVYLWIAQLPIKSADHAKYVIECVDVLFDYFHGSIAGRQEALLRKAEIQIEKEDLIKELQTDNRFQRLQELAAEEMREGKILKKLDTELLTKQLSLFKK